MKIIDLKVPPPNYGSFVITGAPKVGKTQLAASFPRPRFLCDPIENGWRTIQTMDPTNFFDPNFYPEVRTIESATEMLQQITEVKDQVTKRPGSIQTLVVDSVSFYGDLLLTNALRNPPKTRTGDDNTFAIYNFIFAHMRECITRAHDIPINTVWILALDEDGKMHFPGRKGGPLFGLACHYLLRQSAYQGEEGVEFSTSVSGRIHLLGSVLSECSYRAFAKVAGWNTPKVEARQAQSQFKAIQPVKQSVKL